METPTGVGFSLLIAYQILHYGHPISEVIKMDQNGMPLGFGFALAQNPEAMKNFSNLPEARKNEILRQAHSISSKGEMQSLVNSLTMQ